MQENFDFLKFINPIKNKKRRRFFFNPSSWGAIFVFLFGISLLFPFFPEPLVAILFVTQNIFLITAGVMAVMALAYLIACGAKLAISQDSEQEELEELNPVIRYFTDAITWVKNNYKVALPILVLNLTILLLALILTIGYFADPSGSFNFMSSLFNLMDGMFISSIKSLFGTDFLNVHEITVQAASQIFSILASLCAAVFIPEIIRLSAQTAMMASEKRSTSKQSAIVENRELIWVGFGFNHTAWLSLNFTEDQKKGFPAPILSIKLPNDRYYVGETIEQNDIRWTAIELHGRIGFKGRGWVPTEIVERDRCYYDKEKRDFPGSTYYSGGEEKIKEVQAHFSEEPRYYQYYPRKRDVPQLFPTILSVTKGKKVIVDCEIFGWALCKEGNQVGWIPSNLLVEPTTSVPELPIPHNAVFSQNEFSLNQTNTEAVHTNIDEKNACNIVFV